MSSWIELALLAICGLALAPMVRSAMAMPATAHSSMAQPMAAAPAGLPLAGHTVREAASARRRAVRGSAR